MSRRLSEMAEETMDAGSKSDRKMMEDAGFSEDLKKQLEERIAQSAFKAENQQALSEINMPVCWFMPSQTLNSNTAQSSAGKGTRDQAGAPVWTGTESLHDSALRMLDDSHKRLRGPAPKAPPVAVRLPKPKKKASAAFRLANARDKTSIYALAQQSALTEEERGKMRKELKERFTPGARPMPTTLQGLTSLANERIEDAIARGQFKNIPRGKGKNIEKDYNANSPFLDTTEYFMNKIIQRQEIVPPWIEKQQELVKNVQSFRGRLRNDWRRHVARSISSKGGSLDDQIRRAQSFALAEEKINPKQAKVERLSEIDSDGTLSTVTVVESKPEQSATSTVTPESTILVSETAPEDAPKSATELEPTAEALTEQILAGGSPASEPNTMQTAASELATEGEVSEQVAPAPAQPARVLPMAYPFRDPAWEKLEHAYHTLAVEELNSLTRSYNLMAPKVAQKPYYTLARELAKCYADVAPTVADEIGQRARAPKVNVELISNSKVDGVLDQFVGTGHVAKVRDEDLSRKGYGFKEFWRDLFKD